ncbi:MAG: hypothetical protein ACTHJN_13745 [Ginsengibacter sp.]
MFTRFQLNLVNHQKAKTNNEITYKQKKTGCAYVFAIVILIALILNKLGCGKSKDSPNINAYENTYQDTTAQYSFISCQEEKKYLTKSINDLKTRIKNLDNAYAQVGRNNLRWDKYITNYNRYVSQLNDNIVWLEIPMCYRISLFKRCFFLLAGRILLRCRQNSKSERI